VVEAIDIPNPIEDQFLHNNTAMISIWVLVVVMLLLLLLLLSVVLVFDLQVV
jgi:hypothetical protein